MINARNDVDGAGKQLPGPSRSFGWWCPAPRPRAAAGERRSCRRVPHHQPPWDPADVRRLLVGERDPAQLWCARVDECDLRVHAGLKDELRAALDDIGRLPLLQHVCSPTAGTSVS